MRGLQTEKNKRTARLGVAVLGGDHAQRAHHAAERGGGGAGGGGGGGTAARRSRSARRRRLRRGGPGERLRLRARGLQHALRNIGASLLGGLQHRRGRRELVTTQRKTKNISRQYTHACGEGARRRRA